MLDATVITQTSNWIKSVVIGCNFCPFAAKSMLRKSIHYVVVQDATVESSLTAFYAALQHLDEEDEVETTFVILPGSFEDFQSYLDLVELAEQLASDQDYDGIYQVASFHPLYCFEGAEADDPANYTNRSIFPMLHILREQSITDVLENFPDAEGIPDRNVAFAQRKGLQYMQLLRSACMDAS